MNENECASIRAYDADDCDAVLAIWMAASRVGHPFLSEDDLLRHHAMVREIYLPQAETWLALDGGRPIGFIGLMGQSIGGLFVSPEGHGRGYARALVLHAALLKGNLDVEVFADNPIAPGFYRHVGFVETGRGSFDDAGRSLQVIRMRRPAFPD